MRKLIVPLTILLLFFGFVLVVGLVNKTFLKSYYEISNISGENMRIPLPLFSYYKGRINTDSVTFDTLVSFDKAQGKINEYMDTLTTCYDENYFYDKDLDITISRYQVEEGSPFNKIYLSYTRGNYCENQYVLDDNWLTEFIDKADISEVVVKQCVVENNNVDCKNESITGEEIKESFRTKVLTNFTRIDNRNNIAIDEGIDHYLISAYYTVDKNGYMLNVFKYNDNDLAFRVTDANDHSKNAIYQINGDVDQFFEEIYNQ
ncbi:MAG: hypothetical protein PHO63_05465 [Bacilli bacterium]|nr:hypothetical protein [Bacilli bacterium]MDD4809058.1 hypothetical protein [Bacilli bacterium]